MVQSSYNICEVSRMGLFDRMKEPVFLREIVMQKYKLKSLKHWNPYLMRKGKI